MSSCLSQESRQQWERRTLQCWCTRKRSGVRECGPLCLFGKSPSDPLSPLSSFLSLPNILQIDAQVAAFRQNIREPHQELFFLFLSKYRFDKFLPLSLSSCCWIPTLLFKLVYLHVKAQVSEHPALGRMSNHDIPTSRHTIQWVFYKGIFFSGQHSRYWESYRKRGVPCPWSICTNYSEIVPQKGRANTY